MKGRPQTTLSREQVRVSMLARNKANKLKPCAICLRSVGFGMKRAARILRISHANLSGWYKEAGISTDPRHNGTIKKGHGGRYTQRLQATLRSMRVRTKRCLSRKPRRAKRRTFKERYHSDPAFRVYQLCRRRLKKVLHGVKRAGRCMELVGCTTQHLRSHIEVQFKEGMDWSNIGTGEGLWHLDHRIPCAAFDLTSEERQRACFHWSNLRPLWSIDNMRKGKRIE